MKFSFPVSRGVSKGVIQYLIDKSYTSEVYVTSSGKLYDRCPPSNLLNNTIFYTEENNSNGQWVIFEFVSFRVDLKGYSVICNNRNECPVN